MSYLERIKTEFPENSQHKVLPKPTKAPSVSFVSSTSRAFDEKAPCCQQARQSGQDAQKLIESACQDLKITPAQLMALFSKEDLEDLQTGATSVETLRAYAASFADGIRARRIVFHPTTEELIRHN